MFTILSKDVSMSSLRGRYRELKAGSALSYSIPSASRTNHEEIKESHSFGMSTELRMWVNPSYVRRRDWYPSEPRVISTSLTRNLVEKNYIRTRRRLKKANCPLLKWFNEFPVSTTVIRMDTTHQSEQCH